MVRAARGGQLAELLIHVGRRARLRCVQRRRDGGRELAGRHERPAAVPAAAPCPPLGAAVRLKVLRERRPIAAGEIAAAHPADEVRVAQRVARGAHHRERGEARGGHDTRSPPHTHVDHVLRRALVGSAVLRGALFLRNLLVIVGGSVKPRQNVRSHATGRAARCGEEDVGRQPRARHARAAAQADPGADRHLEPAQHPGDARRRLRGRQPLGRVAADRRGGPLGRRGPGGGVRRDQRAHARLQPLGDLHVVEPDPAEPTGRAAGHAGAGRARRRPHPDEALGGGARLLHAQPRRHPHLEPPDRVDEHVAGEGRARDRHLRRAAHARAHDALGHEGGVPRRRPPRRHLGDDAAPPRRLPPLLRRALLPRRRRLRSLRRRAVVAARAGGGGGGDGGGGGRRSGAARRRRRRRREARGAPQDESEAGPLPRCSSSVARRAASSAAPFRRRAPPPDAAAAARRRRSSSARRRETARSRPPTPPRSPPG